MFRRTLAIGAVALIALSLAACQTGGAGSGAGGTPSGSPVEGGTLVIGQDSEPSSLDPAADSGFASTQIKAQIFDALFAVGEDGEIEGSLVESWEQPDPLHYTFTLRSGVTFHDGEELTAEVVKRNLERIADPAGGSTWQDALAAVAAITVEGSDTVSVELSEPYAPLLSVLADQPGYMVSPRALDDPESVANSPVGTGPFRFVSWQPNDRIELEANDDSWRDGEPYLDGVTFRPITDPTAKVTDLLSGQVQAVDYVPAQLIERVSSANGLTYEEGEPNYGATVYVPMNPTKPPFDDPKVRQAVQIAIDRESIVENVTFGSGQPAAAMLGSSSWAFDESLEPFSYDPEAAEDLLGGKEIDVELQVPPTYVQEAQVMSENLAKAGINVSISRMDWGQLIDNYYAGEFEFQLQDVLGLTRSDPDGLLSGFFAQSGSLNGTGAGSPEIDAKLAEARQTDDRDTRKALYAEILLEERELAYYTPIYNPANNRAWSSKVQGMSPVASNGLMSLRQAWIAE